MSWSLILYPLSLSVFQKCGALTLYDHLEVQENSISCCHSENSKADRSGLHLSLKAMKFLTEKVESSTESLRLSVFLTRLISARKQDARYGFIYKGISTYFSRNFTIVEDYLLLSSKKKICCTKWVSLIYEKFSSPPAVAVQRMGIHQSLSRSFSIYYQTAAPNKISYRNVQFPLCIMKCTHVKCEPSLFWSRKLQTQNTRIFWKKNTHVFSEIFFMVSCIPVPPLNSILKEKDIFSLLQKNGSPEYWTVVPNL